jgi:hypothetical protein
MNLAATEAKISTEDFSRYEFKYLLNSEQRAAIEAEISHFMTLDSHAHEDLEGYFVRSLYFENKDATHYYEKIDGVRVRRKFRLRTYCKEFLPDVPLYLEEKGRYIERTYKHRVVIDPAHLELFATSEGHQTLLSLYPGVAVVERFFFDSVRRNLAPLVLVDYLRHPYVSPYDMNFRMTFDSSLSGAASSVLHPDDTANWKAMKAGYTILEIKFFRRIPAWFHRILQAHNMRRLSISKFCESMETCGLAIDLS